MNIPPGILAELDQDISYINGLMTGGIIPEIKESLKRNEDKSLIIAEVAGALRETLSSVHLSAIAATAITLLAERELDEPNSDS